MVVMNKILAEELAPIQAQIEQVQGKIRALEGELREVLAEIEAFSEDKKRFDALRNVCTSLDTLEELGAANLFWDEMSGVSDVAERLNRIKTRVAGFEDEIRGTQEKHGALKAKITKHNQEINFLRDEVRKAYARDERRHEELLVVRKMARLPFREIIMPWGNEEEDEKRYRKALLFALLFCIFFGVLIPLWRVPKPDRAAPVVIPERLAQLVKKEEPPKPEPVKEKPKEEKKPDQDDKPKPTPDEKAKARDVATSTGIFAAKESFSDLLETSAPKLGVESRLTNQSAVAAGSATPSRSLIAVQSTGGSSGGISNSGVSRNIGSGTGNKIGGVGFTRVESAVASLKEDTKPVTAGIGPARTDEEIQIVFDRYKAALYRLYNAELRKNPTLRGKMILKITIETSGEVSACSVQSSDLASPELVAQILERVRKFNFGPKEKVPKTTILYPIDFLPAG